MQVTISQPPKSAMQSGRSNAKKWLMEFDPTSRRTVEPLMGWTSSDDTRQQLKLWFGSKEEAIEYAQAKGLVYQIEEPKTRKIRPKAYADNFANDRLLRWTHWGARHRAHNAARSSPYRARQTAGLRRHRLQLFGQPRLEPRLDRHGRAQPPRHLPLQPACPIFVESEKRRSSRSGSLRAAVARVPPSVPVKYGCGAGRPCEALPARSRSSRYAAVQTNALPPWLVQFIAIIPDSIPAAPTESPPAPALMNRPSVKPSTASIKSRVPPSVREPSRGRGVRRACSAGLNALPGLRPVMRYPGSDSTISCAGPCRRRPAGRGTGPTGDAHRAGPDSQGQRPDQPVEAVVDHRAQDGAGWQTAASAPTGHRAAATAPGQSVTDNGLLNTGSALATNGSLSF